jgi:RNA polymerase sigma-70 factor (ECF subfamily)
MESVAMQAEPSEHVVDRVRAVYEADRARLWRSIYAFSGSRDVADDTVAEAFAQAIRRGDEIRDVAAWIWRSAFAIARGDLQRRRATATAPGVPDVGVDGGDPLRDLLARLGALSPEDRELIVLCHVGGWKPGELAGVLGEPSGRLRVRLHRATRRAREILEDDR